MTTTVSQHLGRKPGTAPLTDEEAAQMRSRVPDDPVKLPPGHLACEGCGVANPGPAILSVPLAHDSRFSAEFTRCQDCQRLHDLAAGDERTRLSLYALAVIGQKPPENIAALVPWMHVIASKVSWLNPDAPSRTMCNPYPWAHIGLTHRAKIREAYVLAIRNRVHLSAPALHLPPPWGGACLFCGIGSLPMAPIEVVRRGGREGAAHAVWRRVLARPSALGGHGPALVDGFVCSPCSEALDGVGSVGVRARARAFEQYVRNTGATAEANRVRSFLDQHDQIVLPGWAALGTSRPSSEPWAHIAIPPPPQSPEVGP